MLCLLAALLTSVTSVASSTPDSFANFAELAKHNRLGVDYQIQVVDRHSPRLVMAIHGGWIEMMTDRLAEKIAGADLNFYAFQGIRPKHNTELHITSRNFDEPQAVKQVQNADHVLSLHGYRDDAESAICLGGNDHTGAANLAKALKAQLPKVKMIFPCPHFEGEGEQNIVNRGGKPGIQLELSSALRKSMEKNPDLFAQVASEIRKSWLAL